MNYIIAGFITGFVLRGLYLLFKPKKPYTLKDFEAQLESDYYGPVPDDGLRCGIITPTKSDFDRWLQDNVNPESYYLFKKVGEYDDLDGVNYFKVQDGYHANKVDLEVVRHAQMRIQKN